MHKPAAGLGSVNILLVDDRPANLIALESVLRDPGYNVVVANSGAEALVRLRERDYALILTDVMMPGMDGFQLTTQVKQTPAWRDIPVIFLTAMNTGVAELISAYGLGAVDYLQKPFEPEVVKAKVAVFAQLYRQKLLIEQQSAELVASERLVRKQREAALKRKAERSQQRSEAQFRTIAEALPVLVAEMDADERLRFCNRAFQSWFGKDANIVGARFVDVAGEAHYADLSDRFAQARAGQSITFEKLTTRRGQTRTFNVTFKPEMNGSRCDGILMVATDISQHKLTEAALQRARTAADAANAAKSAFLANMSHEIRTPLGAVLGFSELLLNPELSENDRRSYLAAMKRNGDLLSSIVNEILDLSKIEAGRIELESRDVELQEIIGDVGTLLRHSAGEKGIELAILTEGPLPGLVRTDPLRLRQILLNIVGNAIKFTEHGKVSVTVRQQLSLNGPRLAFIVSDTGAGIQAEQVGRLFEPFTQADASTKRKHGGTGLGLVLSRRLARLLGGDVVLESTQAGVGSVFVITIDPGKVAPRPRLPELPSERERAPTRELKRLDGAHVLLVEDTADNQLLVGRFLRLAGASVDIAANGREALDKARGNKYDAVLMDLQMPIMDGYEATAELRRGGYRVPIIALTAHALTEEKQKCLKAGFDDHICKPVDRHLLIDRLARYTESATSQSLC